MLHIGTMGHFQPSLPIQCHFPPHGSIYCRSSIHSVFFFFVFFFFVLFCFFCFFFIRTSNFGAEAERSYIFLRFEGENVLKLFLNYMVYTTCISVDQCGRDQETSQSTLPADIWYKELLIMTN